MRHSDDWIELLRLLSLGESELGGILVFELLEHCRKIPVILFKIGFRLPSTIEVIAFDIMGIDTARCSITWSKLAVNYRLQGLGVRLT